MGKYLPDQRFHANNAEVMNGVNIMLNASRSSSRKVLKPLTLAAATVDQAFPFDSGFEPFASALGIVNHCHGTLYSIFTKIMGVHVSTTTEFISTLRSIYNQNVLSSGSAQDPPDVTTQVRASVHRAFATTFVSRTDNYLRAYLAGEEHTNSPYALDLFSNNLNSLMNTYTMAKAFTPAATAPQQELPRAPQYPTGVTAPHPTSATTGLVTIDRSVHCGRFWDHGIWTPTNLRGCPGAALSVEASNHHHPPNICKLSASVSPMLHPWLRQPVNAQHHGLPPRRRQRFRPPRPAPLNTPPPPRRILECP